MDRRNKLLVMSLLLVLTYVMIPIPEAYSHIKIFINYGESEKLKEINEENKVKKVDNINYTKKEVINITNEELLLLSKLVASEARGESYEGQLAVAAVVINRVKDPRFPDDITDVIYQKNAFSVVNNGSINMPPTEESYRAAQAALYGEDPTDEAVYFWNPDIATCSWIKKLNPYMRIGNHVFSK